jgi:hypothetical protein
MWVGCCVLYIALLYVVQKVHVEVSGYMYVEVEVEEVHFGTWYILHTYNIHVYVYMWYMWYMYVHILGPYFTYCTQVNTKN